MILLDTNIVVAYLNGNKRIASKVVESIGKIGLSTIAIAGLDYGAKASNYSGRNLANLYSFIDLVRVILFLRNICAVRENVAIIFSSLIYYSLLATRCSLLACGRSPRYETVE